MHVITLSVHPQGCCVAVLGNTLSLELYTTPGSYSLSSLSMEGMGVIKTFHLGLNAPKSPHCPAEGLHVNTHQ